MFFRKHHKKANKKVWDGDTSSLCQDDILPGDGKQREPKKKKKNKKERWKLLFSKKLSEEQMADVVDELVRKPTLLVMRN